MTVDEQYMVQELLKDTSWLLHGEVRFLNDLNNQDKLSPRDKVWLAKIWQRVLG